MEIQIAVAKTNKYAVTESGDTLEVVERPNGGLSVVLADGQTSGRGAKAVSMMVVRKVISLLAEGVRDGAAARAASDLLYTDNDEHFKSETVKSAINVGVISAAEKSATSCCIIIVYLSNIQTPAGEIILSKLLSEGKTSLRINGLIILSCVNPPTLPSTTITGILSSGVSTVSVLINLIRKRSSLGLSKISSC